MLGDDVVKGLFKLLMLILKLPKAIVPLYRAVRFTGVYWLLLGFAPKWFISGAPAWLLKTMMNIAIALMVLTIIESLIKTKAPRFSLIGLIFKKRESKGFEAKLNDKDKVVQLVAASDLHGIVYGKQGSKYVIQDEQTDGHLLCIGGMGSGKTSGIAIPTLDSWKYPVFAIDLKGELYQKTSNARNKDKIKVFNPMDKNAYGYDPFYILKKSSELSEDARQLALSICPLPAEVKDPFWIKGAQRMLTGLILYYFGQELNFSETMRLIKSSSIKNQITEIMLSDNQYARMEVSEYDGMDEKTLSGIFSELSNHISIFATSENLQRALSGEGKTITPADLEKGYDVFCCIPEEKIDQWKELLGVMVNQFMKAFESRPDGNNNPILFLVDEFPRIGKVETISTGLATLRSKKIRIALFVQSKNQLNAIYGNDIAEVIADNCSYKVILRAGTPETQDWCSKLVGTYDKTKTGTSTNADIFGLGKGSGTSTTTEEKRIIKPEEFGVLKDVVCLFPNGYRRLEKISCYTDETFKKYLPV